MGKESGIRKKSGANTCKNYVFDKEKITRRDKKRTTTTTKKKKQKDKRKLKGKRKNRRDPSCFFSLSF